MKSSQAARQTATALKRCLQEFADPVRAQHSLRYFKTGPGEHAEGDQFWGITVPQQRLVARKFRELPLSQTELLLQSDVHECRLTAIFILVDQFRRSPQRDMRQQLCSFLLQHTGMINNWDLVDSCAAQILGDFLVDQSDRKVLDQLSRSDNLWEQRMGIVATLAFIQNRDFVWTLKLAQRYLSHQHDLIHKATGWMLREVGCQDLAVLKSFLDEFASRMPRIMLRYALEKLSPGDRRRYLLQKMDQLVQPKKKYTASRGR